MFHLELEWMPPEDGHIERIPALPTSRQSFPQAELPMARLQRRDSTKLGRRRHTTDVAESTPTAHTNQTAPKGGAFKKENGAGAPRPPTEVRAFTREARGRWVEGCQT